MKKVANVHSAPAKHWVGDGFHVQSMFGYYDRDKNIDPFLLMDYAAPRHFEGGQADNPRGVGEHPHRGFETVTIAYQGEVSHHDSAGGGGTIGTGDVQWMTAGAGLMHEEYHSKAFSETGGMFEMVQLWVNLPAKYKMTDPKYQAITHDSIAVLDLPNDGGVVRVIAGGLAGVQGIATTFSPINMWDVQMNAGASHQFAVPKSHNLLILVMRGEVQVGEHTAKAGELISFHHGGEDVFIKAGDEANTKLLILTGEPLNEPIAGRGPFVMNTQDEIIQAMQDLRSGRFGRITRD